MSCSRSHRRGSDLVWLWLWCRLEAATPIWPLAWELPYATGIFCSPKKTKRERQEDRMPLVLSSILLSPARVSHELSWKRCSFRRHCGIFYQRNSFLVQEAFGKPVLSEKKNTTKICCMNIWERAGFSVKPAGVLVCLAMPAACGSSRARDGTHSTAGTKPNP